MNTPFFCFESYDYPIIQRGKKWYISIGVIGLLILIISIWTKDVFMPLAIVVTGITWYLFKINTRPKMLIAFYEYELMIDEVKIPSHKIISYFFVKESNYKALYIIQKPNKKMRLPLGETALQEIELALKNWSVPKIVDAKEPLLDLWIRALKL